MMSESSDNPLPDSPAKVVRIDRDAQGRLLVHFQDRSEPLVDARIARCFPWSLPENYISIRTKEGKETALLNSAEDLDPSSRQILLEELRDKVFNPRIKRIVEYKSEFGIASIRAQTDRGEVTFQIRSRDDVRVLSATRALFRDADGNTYEVSDLQALDGLSRRHLEEYF